MHSVKLGFSNTKDFSFWEIFTILTVRKLTCCSLLQLVRRVEYHVGNNIWNVVSDSIYSASNSLFCFSPPPLPTGHHNNRLFRFTRARKASSNIGTSRGKEGGEGKLLSCPGPHSPKSGNIDILSEKNYFLRSTNLNYWAWYVGMNVIFLFYKLY
jgi:hypothetical protein